MPNYGCTINDVKPIGRFAGVQKRNLPKGLSLRTPIWVRRVRSLLEKPVSELPFSATTSRIARLCSGVGPRNPKCVHGIDKHT